MKDKTKIVISAVIAIVLIGFGSFSVLEYLNEPPKWNVESHYYTYYQYSNLSFPLVKVAYSNFTENGNSVSVGYFFEPAGGIPVMDINSTQAWWLLSDWFWLQGEKLSWPYTGVALQIDGSILTVNGTYLNFTNFNRDNVLESATLIQEIAPTNPSDSLAGANYIIYWPYRLVPEASYINAGNYSFNLTVTITPIFEIGPYYFSGQQQSINYQYVQAFVYP